MTTLHVHSLRLFEAEPLRLLRAQLDPAIVLTLGDTPPPATQILIGPRPSPEQLRAAPDLRAMIVPFSGIPLETRAALADFSHIALHNLHHNAPIAAEQTLALLLAAARCVVPADAALRRHDWRLRYPVPSGNTILLEGKTAVILGYGAVGRRVARGCRALGMHVVALRRTPTAVTPADAAHEIHAADDLHAQLPRAGALIICLPFTPATDGLIGAAELDLLPANALLVNTGRGAIVDEAALFYALRTRRLFAAGLDVWWRYPADENGRAHTPPSDYPFHELDNVVMTPHKGGDALEVDELRMRELARLLNAAARGEPMPNRVWLEQGY